MANWNNFYFFFLVALKMDDLIDNLQPMDLMRFEKMTFV